MDKELLISSIRSIPDFPKKGILFRDVTTLFNNADAFREAVDAIYELYKDKGITKVAGLESRGFILGAALAYRLGAGFVTIRKPGKLPCDTYSEEYMKEYGTDTLEIHTDALTSDDVAGHVNSSNGLVDGDLHWVTNHRLLGMVKFTF